MARKKSRVVISDWKGITTLRLKPARVKQTTHTIQAGQLFGMAANRAAIVRKLLMPVLPEPSNRLVIYSFQEAFYQWLSAGALNDHHPIENIPFFEGVSFNAKNKLSQFLSFPFTTKRLPAGEAVFSLPAVDPALQIKWPHGISTVNMFIAAASIVITNPLLQTYWQTVVAIQNVPGVRSPQQILLPVVVGSGNLIMVTVALQICRRG